MASAFWSIVAASVVLVACGELDPPAMADAGGRDTGLGDLRDGGTVVDRGAADVALPSALDDDPEGADAPPEMDPVAALAEPCVVGASVCVGLDTMARCLRDRTWAARPCAADQLCLDEVGRCVGVQCAPESTWCNAAGEVASCDERGRFGPTASCPEWTACRDGRCACDPGLSVCLDDHTLMTCSAGGEPVERRCADGEVCGQGRCQPAECMARVLILLDHSGSVGVVWDEMQASIRRIVDDHPTVQFGLLAYPGTPACVIGGPWPDVSIGPDRGPAIARWMADNPPIGGNPLLDTIEWLVVHRDQVWGQARERHLVMIGDGENTCGCDGDCARERVRVGVADLRANGVISHAIGLNYQPHEGLFDIFAAEGDGPFDETIEADDVASIEVIFEDLFDGVKPCD